MKLRSSVKLGTVLSVSSARSEIVRHRRPKRFGPKKKSWARAQLLASRSDVTCVCPVVTRGAGQFSRMIHGVRSDSPPSRSARDNRWTQLSGVCVA